MAMLVIGVTRTELVSEGKCDEHANLVDRQWLKLPLQIVERVDHTRAKRHLRCRSSLLVYALEYI